MPRPNFLIVMTDQQRANHLSCAGHPTLQTPNLDRLASEGVRFANAYVNNPVCMPSRSTLLTGQTPRGHGVRTNGINLSRDVPTVTEALRQSGYRTHAVGKIHVNVYGLTNGVDPQTLAPPTSLKAPGCGVSAASATCRCPTTALRRRRSRSATVPRWAATTATGWKLSTRRPYR
jgi:arylsulfatase A-like enzyme